MTLVQFGCCPDMKTWGEGENQAEEDAEEEHD